MKRIISVAIIVSAIMGFYSEQLKDNFLNSKRKYIVALTNIAGTSGGTGFYVKTPSGNTVIMTNNHVCNLAVNNVLIASTLEYNAVVEVITTYLTNDLCILTAPKGISGALHVARSVAEGENIYVLGHPMLMPLSLTKGQISGEQIVAVLQGYDVPNCYGPTYRKIEADPITKMFTGVNYACVRDTMAVNVTANILPGNSGSPVLNAYGNVVGVAFAGSPGTSRGLIVPLEDVKDFLSDK